MFLLYIFLIGYFTINPASSLGPYCDDLNLASIINSTRSNVSVVSPVVKQVILRSLQKVENCELYNVCDKYTRKNLMGEAGKIFYQLPFTSAVVGIRLIQCLSRRSKSLKKNILKTVKDNEVLSIVTTAPSTTPTTKQAGVNIEDHEIQIEPVTTTILPKIDDTNPNYITGAPIKNQPLSRFNFTSGQYPDVDTNQPRWDMQSSHIQTLRLLTLSVQPGLGGGDVTGKKIYVIYPEDSPSSNGHIEQPLYQNPFQPHISSDTTHPPDHLWDIIYQNLINPHMRSVSPDTTHMSVRNSNPIIQNATDPHKSSVSSDTSQITVTVWDPILRNSTESQKPLVSPDTTRDSKTPHKLPLTIDTTQFPLRVGDAIFQNSAKRPQSSVSSDTTQSLFRVWDPVLQNSSNPQKPQVSPDTTQMQLRIWYPNRQNSTKPQKSQASPQTTRNPKTPQTSPVSPGATQFPQLTIPTHFSSTEVSSPTDASSISLSLEARKDEKQVSDIVPGSKKDNHLLFDF